MLAEQTDQPGCLSFGLARRLGCVLALFVVGLLAAPPAFADAF